MVAVGIGVHWVAATCDPNAAGRPGHPDRSDHAECGEGAEEDGDETAPEGQPHE